MKSLLVARSVKRRRDGEPMRAVIPVRFTSMATVMCAALGWAQPALVCTVARDGASGMRLGWNAIPAETYVVESAVDVAGPWLTSAMLEATNPSPSHPIAFDAADRFWRVAKRSAPGANPDPDRWVWVPPGTFLMGSPETEPSRTDAEGPQTLVTLSVGYWMSRYEVTQAEYEAVTGQNAALFLGDGQRPVESVSWSDAIHYCAQLTDREGAAGRLPAGFVYRLPTEAEWEHACRAGTTTRFHFGDDLADPDFTELMEYAWVRFNSWYRTPPEGPSVPFEGVFFTTHPVGVKKPSRLGLYDICGNVWEWCWDVWTPQLPGGRVVDPTGPGAGSDHVIRGGGWSSYGGWCRSAYRMAWADSRTYFMGIRPVLGRPID